MIVDSPVVTSLAQDGKKIPQEGDSQLIIPPAILLTIPPVFPLNVATVNNVAQNESFIVEQQRDHTNAAGLDDQTVMLSKGLWHCVVDVSLAASGIASLKFVELMLGYAGYVLRVASVPASGSSHFTKQIFCYLNLRQDATVYLRFPTLGATEFAYVRLGLVGSRLL